MDAITKLEQEIKNPGKLSRIEAAMLEPVGKMLISFCRQDARFASAVFEKKQKAMQGLPEENRNKIRANVRSALERMLEEMRDE